MKLKSRLLVVATLAASLSTLSADAQIRENTLKGYSHNFYEWGARAGANFQQLAAFPFSNAYNTGGFGGAYIRRRKDFVGVQLEVNVANASYTTAYPVGHNFTSDRTVKNTDTTTKGKFNSLYVNIPLMLEIRMGYHFAFQFGAQYSYLLSNSDANDAFTKKFGTADVFNKTNVSVLAGFEGDVCKKWAIGARYAIGMSDVNAGKYKPLTDRWHIGSGQVYLTYRIGKWGEQIYK